MQTSQGSPLGGARRVRDLSSERARLTLTGPDARRFLHGMCTNDILALQPGRSCRAAMLTVKGKLLGDFTVLDRGEAGLFLEMQARVGGALRGALDRHLIMDDATVTDVSGEVGQLGVYGDGAGALLGVAGLAANQAAPLAVPGGAFGDGAWVVPSAELGVEGFHVFGPPATVAALRAHLLAGGATELPGAEAETLRVEAGTPLFGADMDEDRMPMEAGLDDAVSHTKGCYLGQEVVVRLRDRGHLNRKLVGLRLEGLDAGAALPAAGTRLAHESRPSAGTLTSVVRSPRLGAIALGYAHRSVWEPGTALALVDEAGARLGPTAVVVPLPFSPGA